MKNDHYGNHSESRKEMKKIIKAIRREGGKVTMTANGHFKVLGPDGLTVISSIKNDKNIRKKTLARLRNIGIYI